MPKERRKVRLWKLRQKQKIHHDPLLKKKCDVCGTRLAQPARVPDKEQVIFCDDCFQLWLEDPNNLLSPEEISQEVRNRM